jgi:hypothetical protein
MTHDPRPAAPAALARPRCSPAALAALRPPEATPPLLRVQLHAGGRAIGKQRRRLQAVAQPVWLRQVAGQAVGVKGQCAEVLQQRGMRACPAQLLCYCRVAQQHHLPRGAGRAAAGARAHVHAEQPGAQGGTEGTRARLGPLAATETWTRRATAS